MRDATLAPDSLTSHGPTTELHAPPYSAPTAGRAAPVPRDELGGGRGRERRTLTRADWIGAAIDALARDGLRAVAVEPLAERLGATKGSFYWHFRDRSALLEAAVEHWERTATDEPLAELARVADAQERYRQCAAWLIDARRDMRIFMVLLWHADHPVISPVIERVLAKRMAFSQLMREEAGSDAAGARQSVLHTYAVWLGLQLLRRAAPGMIPENGAPEGFMEYLGGLELRAVGFHRFPSPA
jgi:AcrR family transcriptional regulator